MKPKILSGFIGLIMLSFVIPASAGYMWTNNITVSNLTKHYLHLGHIWHKNDTTWGSPECPNCRPSGVIGPITSADNNDSYQASAFMFEDIHCGAAYNIFDKFGNRLATCNYDILSKYNYGFHVHVRHLSCDNSNYKIIHHDSGSTATFFISD